MEELTWNHLKEVLEQFGAYFVERAKQNLLQDGSNASGNLTNSIVFHVDVTETHYEVTVELEDYWYYVENGRKSGKFPPLDKIKEWIEIKPVLPHVMTLKNGKTVLPTVDQLAYLIGRKIANEGTQGTGFFSEAKEDAIKRFELAIEYAIREDLDEYIGKLVEELPEDLLLV